MSGVVINDEAIQAPDGSHDIEELTNFIEEADSRIIPQVDWLINIKKAKNIVVISNDTDTFALLLYYIPHFINGGVEKLWQQYGSNPRMLPIHAISSHLGHAQSKTIVKAHILTGQDCISKIGTKHCALVTAPLHNLSNFGESDILS